MDENNITIEKEVKKINFFKKFWYSIMDFDKYMDMIIQGPFKAIIYVIELTFLMCLFLISAMCIHFIMNNGIPQNFIISNELKINCITTFSLFFQFFIILLTYVVILAIIGYITARIMAVKLRYSAVYSIASYSITLATVLYTINLIVNIFIVFKVKYIEAAFMAISYIYIITVIFMIRADIIKKHQELLKIIEEQKKVREQLEKDKQEKDKEEQNRKNEEDKEDGLLEEEDPEVDSNEV